MTGRNGGANPGRGKMRLFVALDLPESVRDEVEAWRRETLTDPGLRHNAGHDGRTPLYRRQTLDYYVQREGGAP